VRSFERTEHTIRPLTFERGFTATPGGSVLVRWGRTKVLCTAMLEEGVPPFLLGTDKGWLTAEYAMLPGSTRTRKARDSGRGKVDGRSTEIQRLVGRALRACIDLRRMPGMTLFVDCDVLEADGGTRTAAINGAVIAVHDAIRRALERGEVTVSPLTSLLSAVSVGKVDGETWVDLDAAEDNRAEVDLNVVLTERDEYVEVQGTAERGAFDHAQLLRFLDAARAGAHAVRDAQRAAIREDAP
jgi:ribonuclease PH